MAHKLEYDETERRSDDRLFRVDGRTCIRRELVREADLAEWNNETSPFKIVCLALVSFSVHKNG